MSKNELEGLKEEYALLREEVLRRQDARQWILGYVLTALGAVIGLVLQDSSPYDPFINYSALALITFCLLVVMAAVLSSVQHTQQIDVISAYIRRFIEPYLGGVRWESRWSDYRVARKRNESANR